MAPIVTMAVVAVGDYDTNFDSMYFGFHRILNIIRTISGYMM